MTIFTVHNEFLINDYLEKYKPDFVLIIIIKFFFCFILFIFLLHSLIYFFIVLENNFSKKYSSLMYYPNRKIYLKYNSINYNININNLK